MHNPTDPPPPGRIRVLVAHRHELVCELLELRLAQEQDIDATCLHSGTDEAVATASETAPDVVLIDPDSPGRSPFEACRAIQAANNRTRILFLGADTSDTLIEQAINARCSGYLTAHNHPDALVQAIRTVAAGGQAFCRTIRDRIVIDPRTGPWLESRRTKISTLSKREAEVLAYIARGLTKKQMAERMHISIKTVDNHASSLMRKLDIHNRVELARFAIRERLVEA